MHDTHNERARDGLSRPIINRLNSNRADALDGIWQAVEADIHAKVGLLVWDNDTVHSVRNTLHSQLRTFNQEKT